jgi:type II secretory pathway predicted ATPase ExeA
MSVKVAHKVSVAHLSRTALVLIGQPTLAIRLRQGIFPALDQRISIRYAIGGWTSPNQSATCATISSW